MQFQNTEHWTPLLETFKYIYKLLDNKIALAIPSRFPNSLFLNLKCFLDTIIAS